MDRSTKYSLQIGAAEEDLQTSGAWATPIRTSMTMRGHRYLSMRTMHMSTRQTPSSSLTQVRLHDEDPSQSSTGLAVLSDASVSSPVFSSHRLYRNQQPDAILYSLDKDYFYAHTPLLLSLSRNKFGDLIEKSSSTSSNNLLALSMTVSSDVLDINPRAIYLIEFPSTLPAFSTLGSTVRILEQHGVVPLSKWTGPASRMFTALTSLAPEHALELYALVAKFDVEPLVAHVSSFLLELPLFSIPQTMAERIGGVYMRTLGNLQIGRINSLKRILLPRPLPHPIRGNERSKESQITLTLLYAVTETYVFLGRSCRLASIVYRGNTSTTVQ